MGHGAIISGNTLPGAGNHIIGDVAYTWDLSGSSLGTGTKITFDQGETVIFRNSTFEVALWTSSSDLTVGAANASHGSVQGVAVTHDISGEINFEIRQIAGANDGAVLADTFEFFTIENMGPINGIGSAGGSPEVFNTYLWGDTGAFDGACIGDCGQILSAFYAAEGLGIDIAFSGAQVPEPGALVLIGVGLLGLGLARRRRR
ncbi:MAG: PEP-CTERM sorting domain-containing protein [Alphaproteobacteria bacterium]|nr:PEP-CTERM sorting domain-containing protein [Alphaproteobacteria bacterium]